MNAHHMCGLLADLFLASGPAFAQSMTAPAAPNAITAPAQKTIGTPSARKGIDGAFSYVTADLPDPLELLIQIRPGSPYDYSSYSALGFANPLTAAATTTNPVQRARLVTRAQANYMDNVETLAIYSSDVRLFMNKRITGPAVSELSYLYTPWAATVGAP